MHNCKEVQFDGGIAFVEKAKYLGVTVGVLVWTFIT